MGRLLPLLAACSLATGCDAPADDPHDSVNGIRQLPAAELWTWLADDPSAVGLVDVRIVWDFRRGHLLGAINVPGAAVVDPGTGELIDGGRALTDRFPNRDERLVFYCEGTECNVSQVLAETAREIGYRDVWRLVGGFPAWAEAGYFAAVRPIDFCTTDYFPLAETDELVDVRPAAEFAAGTIPGASSVPRESFLDAAGEPVADGAAFTGAVGSAGGLDFVLATSEAEARSVASFAVARGYGSIRILEGTYTDWEATECAGATP